jgi:hypothetical protein
MVFPEGDMPCGFILKIFLKDGADGIAEQGRHGYNKNTNYSGRGNRHV